MASRSHDRLEMPDSSTVGERAFAGKLFSEYADRLQRMIEKRVGPPLEAREILQNVILKAMTKWRNDGGGELPPYWQLYCMARDCISEAWRDHYRRREQPLPDRSSAIAQELVRSMTSPSQRLRNEEEAARLVALIEEMGVDDRQVLEMRLMDELSARETGEVLGIKPSAVDARYARARKRLLKLYRQVCPEPDSRQSPT